ncbi:ATP-binding protein [Dyella sp. M7H15-1]|uniref:ATP-binding protein n=1 Tax=Dyella sp. M7H15-1 TaxID=2501295 RepID=UPI0013E8A7AB|nr:ATP-binding protein [Dyella sp. M7H15-1]
MSPESTRDEMREEPAPAESLSTALDRVYRCLMTATGQSMPDTATAPAGERVMAEQPSIALQRLRHMFDLSEFERDVLLLCAGAAAESRFLAACSAAQHERSATWPSFGLALSVLHRPHWSAISRARPLRYWNLIEVTSSQAGTSLMYAPLRIDERILLYLLGVPAQDERLEAYIRPIRDSHFIVDEQRDTPLEAMLDVAVSHWQHPAEYGEPILLCGDHPATRKSAFMGLCRRASLQPYQLDTGSLPGTPVEREQLARLWMRESALRPSALYIRCKDGDDIPQLAAWLEGIQAPIAVDTPAGSAAERLPGWRIDVPALSAEQRKTIWMERLGPDATRLNGSLDRVVEYFHFDESTIRLAATTARESALASRTDADRVTWHICRQYACRSLDHLARRIEPRANWSELVLPPEQTEILRQIAIHLRQRAVVNDRWGFAQRYSRGLGLSALFAGESGTGKTMAAEILAGELDLDLYQIDLASLVSKYIGETEKNLQRVFDAAEESGAILLFDEADALFGKRSDVRDSHDRYANLEVSYLLQRMDSYRGVAILTTNMRHVMDPAFVRRIRFIVQFPFPDTASRERIWKNIFPASAPLDALDYARLAQLNVSGGVIRNIAMHAAFLAAEQNSAIGARHMLSAARIEYSKLEKPLTASETRGWT